MDGFLKDIRYGLRNLLKRPGSTAIAVVTLALGIGANAAIFSFVDGLLFRPLAGVEQPDRLVGIYTSDYSSGRFGASSYPDYIDLHQQGEAYAEVAAYQGTDLTRAVGETVERLSGAYVTSNYFDVLGVRAHLGRTQIEDDVEASANPVVVISYPFWQRHFGADLNVVGRPLTLSNRSYTVIGVTSESFRGLRIGSSPEVWLPLNQEIKNEVRGSRGLGITGRLRPGVSIDQAQAQITAIANRLAHAYPQTNMGTLAQPDVPRPMAVVPEARVGPAAQVAVRQISSLLLVVVGLVLLIACANVANLLLARASSRRREIAIRLALGASRGRLIRQLLTESILLAVIGGAAGLFVGLWTADLIPTFFPPGEVSGLDMSLNWRVFGLTAALTLFTGVLFGLAPAVQSSRPDVVSSLKDAKAGRSRGLMRFGLRNVLVTSQIAISLLLLIGAGLFLRSLHSAMRFDPGFEVQNLILASLGTESTKMSETQAQLFYQELLARVGSQPGVRSVTLTKVVPLSGGGQRRQILIEGYQPQPNEDTELNTNVVGPDYFGTLSIPLVQGRDFNEQDRDGSPGVVVVNEAFAQRYFPGELAVGKRVRTDSEGQFLEIIGVARTAKYRNLREPPLPFIYLPLAQEMQSNMTVLVRTTTDSANLLPVLRSELQLLDRNVPIESLTTMTAQVDAALATDRMTAVLLGIFGGAALLLAVVGLYGVMSYSVAERTHEIGVRMALGAQTLDVLRLVVRNGMTLALIGVAIGLAAAFAFTRIMESLLFEVTATDAMTYASVSVGLLLVALLACYIPARRATKVDPLAALRYE